MRRKRIRTHLRRQQKAEKDRKVIGDATEKKRIHLSKAIEIQNRKEK